MKLISPTPSNATLLALTLAIVPALTSPTPQINSPDTKRHVRRETDEEILDRCTYKEFDFNEDDKGRIVCQDTRGEWSAIYSCEECFGLNGYEAIKTSKGASCAIVTDRDGKWDRLSTQPTACPGDEVPETDPDGNPSKEVYEGILDAWCAAAGSGGLFGFPNMLACYGWAFVNTDTTLEENKAGVTRTITTPFSSSHRENHADIVTTV
jgi:hypothetical protein